MTFSVAMQNRHAKHVLADNTLALGKLIGGWYLTHFGRLVHLMFLVSYIDKTFFGLFHPERLDETSIESRDFN